METRTEERPYGETQGEPGRHHGTAKIAGKPREARRQAWDRFTLQAL